MAHDATWTPTREVGRKFYADGTARRFPGNTIICFVDPESPLGQAASAFQAALHAQPWGAKFALLPPSSFHMTVMDLLCDQVRVAERWSPHLPLDAPLPATDAFFLERVPAVPLPTLRTMRVDSIYTGFGLMLMLEPTDAATEAALRGYRDAIASATGVRHPDHNSYGFHMSLGYRLYALDAAETASLTALCAAWAPQLRDAGATLALPPPVLCSFADMTAFVPLTATSGA
jgi:hypothetical protein